MPLSSVPLRPSLPLQVSSRAACQPIAPVCPWEAQCQWAPWVHSLAPPTRHLAPLAKAGDVLEAAVYSTPFSLSNGASHFLQHLLRCRLAARQQRAQQGLPGPLQPVLLLALCPEPCAAQARLVSKVSMQSSTSPLSLCSGWPSAPSWNGLCAGLRRWEVFRRGTPPRPAKG